MSEAIYDVAIIGGGPAGSTAATLLARAGRRVIVCEREKFPRFHIGESLLPASMKTFARLGVLEKFEQAGFLPKFGGEIASACADEGVKFYFEDGFRSTTASSYQVTRARVRPTAARSRRGKRSGSARGNRGQAGSNFSPTRVELQVAGKAAPRGKNQSALCDRRQRTPFRPRQSFQLEGNLCAPPENVRSMRISKGWRSKKAATASLTLSLRGLDRWFWHIPLSRERSSIGVVLDTSAFQASEEIARGISRGSDRRTTFSRPAHEARPPGHARLCQRGFFLSPEPPNRSDAGCSRATPPDSSTRFSAAASSSPSSPANSAPTSSTSCSIIRKRAPRLFARYERLLRRAMKGLSAFHRRLVFEGIHRGFLYPQDVFQIPAGGERRPRRQHQRQLRHPLADVGLLFHRLAAALPAALPAPHARSRREANDPRPNRSAPPPNEQWILTTVTSNVRGAFVPRPRCRSTGTRGRRHEDERSRPPLLFLALLCLTSCETLRHQFVSARRPIGSPRSASCNIADRRPRSSAKCWSVIPARGDFELTFSKGPGVTLLTVRQDDKFVRVSGPLARGSWSGPPNEAPSRLRGWVSLRELLLHSKAEPIGPPDGRPRQLHFRLLTPGGR